MDIIMNYVAYAGISEIDNIYGAAIRNLHVRAFLIEDITLEEQEIRDRLITYTREPFKGTTFKGTSINRPPCDEYKEPIFETLEEKQSRESRADMRKSTFSNPIPRSKSNLMRVISFTHMVERVFFKSVYFYLFPYLVLPISYIVY
jgi:hypothetical protein